MEPEYLDIVKNYKNNYEAEALLKKEINNYFSDYDHEENKEFLNISYEYLINKTEFEPIEYRFLCWLSEYHSKGNNLNKPHIVFPETIDISEFEKKFLGSQERNSLYRSLKEFIHLIKERYNLKELKTIVGGSFADLEISIPNDIDIVILVPKESETAIHENYLYAANLVPKGIDVKILPLTFDIRKYKAYSNLTHLGNKATNKNKKPTSNNTFEKRRIYMLSIL